MFLLCISIPVSACLFIGHLARAGVTNVKYHRTNLFVTHVALKSDVHDGGGGLHRVAFSSAVGSLSL